MTPQLLAEARMVLLDPTASTADKFEEEAGPAESQLSAAETTLEASQARLLAAERTAGLWQSIHVFARLLEWHADNPVPPGVVTESDEPSPDPAEFFAGVREICRKAEMLLDHEEDLASGAPRRRAVVIGPRIRMAYGESRPASAKAKPKDGIGKSKKLSRTEQAQVKAERERQARQALLLSFLTRHKRLVWLSLSEWLVLPKLRLRLTGRYVQAMRISFRAKRWIAVLFGITMVAWLLLI